MHGGKNMSFSIRVNHRLMNLFCLFFSQCIKATVQNQIEGPPVLLKIALPLAFSLFVSFYCRHLFLLNMIKLFTQNSAWKS